MQAWLRYYMDATVHVTYIREVGVSAWDVRLKKEAAQAEQCTDCRTRFISRYSTPYFSFDV